MTDIFCGVVKGIPKVSGTSFFHVGIAVIHLPGLVSRWRHSGISQYLIRGIKAVKIANLSDDHCTHPVTDTGNGKDWRLDFFIHDSFDGSFNFVNLRGQLLNQFNGVLEFQRFRRHNRTDRVSCGFAKDDSSIFSVSAFGTLRKQIGKSCEVCGCDSIGARELGKQSVDGWQVKGRNKFFQFREKKVIRIAGDDKPVDVVKSQFMKLTGEHIRFVLSCLKENTTRVRNMKQYLLAALYNAPLTISNYYSSRVNHDMANGRI